MGEEMLAPTHFPYEQVTERIGLDSGEGCSVDSPVEVRRLNLGGLSFRIWALNLKKRNPACRRPIECLRWRISAKPLNREGYCKCPLGRFLKRIVEKPLFPSSWS